MTRGAEASISPPRARQETQDSSMSTVWVYFVKEAEADEKPDLMIFATEDAAHRWFAENDPEGVAFEYPVIDE
jgi:hypothetical protein